MHSNIDQETVYIVIPVHNRLNDTIECLRSFALQTFRNFRLIVVDDGSEDGTGDYLRRHFRSVVVLKGDGALWWAGAVNKGVRYALRSAKDTDMIMTINNDVFFENDFLAKMVASAKAAPGTLLNPISVDSRTKRVISGGNRMISWMLAISHHPYYGRPLDKIDASKMIFVHMLSGRGTLIPVTVFRKIGLYDNRLFPQYGADNEFTCRAFRRGFKLAILPGVVLYVNKATTGLDPLYTNINLFEIFEAFFSIKSTNNLKMRWRFARKCAPPYTAFSYFFISFLKILVQSTIVNYVKRVFV